MKSTRNHIVWIWLLLLAGSSLPGQAQENETEAVLRQVGTVDICSDNPADKYWRILIDIGNVSRSDSLYGFNFGIRYDPGKLRFDIPLYINTLSEFFEERKVGAAPEDSLIIGFATTLNIGKPPVSGNKALMVLTGEFISDCPDTSRISIEYLEFTDEFQKEISSYKDEIVKSEVADKPDRLLQPIFSTDTLKFDEDSVRSVFLKFEYKSEIARLDTIEFELEADIEDAFEIKEINAVNNDIEFYKKERTETGYKLGSALKRDIDGSFVIELLVENLKKDSIFEKIFIDPATFTTDKCSCISRFEKAEIILQAFKADTTQDTTSVLYQKRDDPAKGYYDKTSDSFVFDCDNEYPGEILLYDIRGNLQIRKKCENDYKSPKLNAAMLPKGIYFAIIRTIMNERKKIVLIKN